LLSLSDQQYIAIFVHYIIVAAC